MVICIFIFSSITITYFLLVHPLLKTCSLRSLLNKDIIADFHWNDVPASPPRDELGDKDRIYPGDGILPLVGVLKDLKKIGYSGPISLEMFNREQWKSDLKEVAAIGKKKILNLIEKANG